MFTGIIKDMGTILSVENGKFRVSVTNPDIQKKLHQGASIAVNGTCFTVIESGEKWFEFQAIPETLYRTTFGKAKKDDRVNLEPCLGPSDVFEGHIVQGHVDGIGTIYTIEPEGNSYIFTIHIDPSLSKYLVEKGSVAVNGISLTVVDAEKDYFTIAIIPYTWDHTNLSLLAEGDTVNIEVDVLAKYIEKLFPHFKS
ncbi:MAG TPA: riboflavin synthase [Patescibacteria group bacterium]|nr:riboflavin synthase [Patescibacteria group bacterium]